ncbi:MAG: DUF192 domain-containing protein, partial [Deltaproteobacteria bacterium]|nr:DUF192 domain-containing protein [Deltaproteobacteria bacterium]
MRIIPGIAVSLILAFCVACEKAPLPEAFPSLSLATVILTTKSGPHAVSVEVAKTDEERAKGLMFRESLPENGGMWFVFPHEVIDPFWMKNT